MSYAFVFLNAIVGFLSALLRIAKAMILGLFFFSRLDRTVLMPGFQRWDKGKLPEKRMLRKLIPPCSSLLTYHLPFSACRTVVCLPKSWKIGQLPVASQTFLLAAFDIFSNYRSIWTTMQRGTMDWRKAWGKVIEGFWLCHNEIYGLSPPPFNPHWQSICNSSSLNSVRDDWFPFLPHWKPFDHVQNPFSPSPPRW